MQENKSTKQLTEAALFLGIGMVFSWIGFSFMPLLLILLPLPFIVSGVKIGTKYTIISIILCFFLLFFTVDPTTGLFFILIFAGMILSLDWGIRNRKKSHQTFLVALFFGLFGMVLFFLLFQQIMGFPFQKLLTDSFQQMISINESLVNAYGLEGAESKQMLDQLTQAFELVRQIFPATLILYVSFLVYLNYSLSLNILRKMRITNLKQGKFRDFEIPKELFLGILGFIILSLFLFTIGGESYRTIFLNVVVLSSIIFFIEGLSLLSFWMNQYKVNGFIKVIVYLISFLYSPFVMVLTGLGFLDRLVHFRKRQK